MQTMAPSEASAGNETGPSKPRSSSLRRTLTRTGAFISASRYTLPRTSLRAGRFSATEALTDPLTRVNEGNVTGSVIPADTITSSPPAVYGRVMASSAGRDTCWRASQPRLMKPARSSAGRSTMDAVGGPE